MIETLWLDVRHAFRLLGRNKAFTFAALATLALAIGANTGVFSVVYGVLSRPLPYAEADRIVRLSEVRTGEQALMWGAVISNYTFFGWSESPRTLEQIAVYGARAYTLAGFDEPLRIQGAAVTPQLFPLLRAVPALGRFFREEEGGRHAKRVVVLSHRLWRERFSGDPGIVGRTLSLDGNASTVVGSPRWTSTFPIVRRSSGHRSR